MTEFTSPDEKEYHLWYDSFEEMEAQMPKDINRVRENADLAANQRYRHTIDSYRWYGCESYAAAISKVKNGWPELMELLQDKIERLKRRVDLGTVEAVAIESRRRKRSRQDYGDHLDMTRVWSGQLDTAWERPTRRMVLLPSQRHATIYVDLALRSRDSSGCGVWRAAAAYCMFEMLTRLGISTEIWAGQSSSDAFVHGPWLTCSGVCIKPYNQTLNDERLVAMLSAAFFRTYGFGMLYASRYQLFSSLGYPARGTLKPLRDRGDAGERVFRVGEALDEDSAVDTIKKVISTLQEDYTRVGKEIA